MKIWVYKVKVTVTEHRVPELIPACDVSHKPGRRMAATIEG